MNGMFNGTFLVPTHWSLREGSKGQNHYISTTILIPIIELSVRCLNRGPEDRLRIVLHCTKQPFAERAEKTQRPFKLSGRR